MNQEWQSRDAVNEETAAEMRFTCFTFAYTLYPHTHTRARTHTRTQLQTGLSSCRTFNTATFTAAVSIVGQDSGSKTCEERNDPASVCVCLCLCVRVCVCSSLCLFFMRYRQETMSPSGSPFPLSDAAVTRPVLCMRT